MHAFFQLREQLAALHFDPAQDKLASQQSCLKDYLDFYQLHFAQTICQNHFVGTFEAYNFTLVAHYWLPARATPRGTIFILHGYYDHVGLYRHAIEFALAEGFVAVAYDQPGHGLSSGERAVITHFAEYAHIFECCLKKSENLPKPWFGLGQSTGGSVLLHTLMIEKQTDALKGIVLLAPLIRPTGWKTGIWSYRLLKYFVKKIPRHFSNNSNDVNFVRFCHEQDPLQSRYLSVTWVGAMKEWLESFSRLPTLSTPALLIQGDADTTVDWRSNVAMLKAKLSRVEYCELEQARHHLVNEREDIRERLFTRVQQFLLASENPAK